ncbi:N-acetyl sugar amidotransferase [Neptuniibacter sp. QD37_6]|uniref:N-acetyl sugar amidotransferase n=1 Tax=Neptuniibacter sp. QD37_6 TaxID=3398210 RepID=UPI0039F4AB42
MSEVDFCKRCLYTTEHPLGLVLDDEGICSGCRVHEEKDILDWDYRWSKLERIVSDYRSTTGQYDCIIPVTGGQDSYFIVHLVKNVLKMNPLLVAYNKYFNTPLGIRNLSNLRITFDCDILFQNVNPQSVRNITKTTLRSLGSIYWPILAGHSVFPVQTAVRYKVPLIIWGAHQGVEQVGMFSHEHEVEMTRRYRKDHDLMGHEADDLLSVFDTLSEEDIWQYRYPSNSDLNDIGVRGIYLGNYVRWDPKAQHELMIKLYNYKTSSFSRTFDTYDFVDCYNYMNLHDQLKLYKCGYSKVTDHACREIRHGRLSREKAIQLVKYYERQPVDFKNMFTDWLGVTDKSLTYLMDLQRNPKHWINTAPLQWEFNGLSHHLDGAPSSDLPERAIFEENSSMNYDREEKYIVFGRGLPL